MILVCFASSQCKHQVVSDQGKANAQDEMLASKEMSQRLMLYVKKFIKTPCTIASFVRHPGFKAVLVEPGNVGPGPLSYSGYELKKDESHFILQPPYMAENFDAIYFVTSESLDLHNLRIAFENAKNSRIRIVNVLVSTSTGAPPEETSHTEDLTNFLK